MKSRFQGIEAANALMRLALATTQMNMAASEVILRRTMMMSHGAMSAPEAMGMVMEKATAFTLAAEKATIAAARGADPVKIATAAMRPIRAKTRSNVRKLRG